MKAKLNGLLVLVVLLCTQSLLAQDNISGVVTDQSGLPIPAVNVLVKGTQIGTQTDFDGKFTIQASPGQVLVFSFLGMKTREIPAAQNMTVQMEDDAVQLEGVVVTALGIKREKKALGYSTTVVKSEELTRVTSSNPFETLSGKIAGVDITTPQTPGASNKIIVRGISSITGGNAPLYVVDGTPINNSASNANQASTNATRSFDAGTGINDLDPNNIESINFLKGAAATALYGSRGSNGVFIITTKRGRNQNKINVEFSTSVEMSEVARVPHLQNRFGQGWNGLSYSQLATGVGSSNENGSWGPLFNGEVRPWGTIVDNAQQIKPYVVLEDNVRDFYDTGILTSNSINISGGSDIADFALGFTNLDSDGVMPTDADSFEKRSLAFNGGLKTDKFVMRASINYTNREQYVVNTGQGDNAGEGATLQQELLQVPRDVSVVDLQDYINNPFNTLSNFYTPYAQNPYFTLNENETKLTGNNIFGNINMTYNITDELSAAWQIGGNYRSERLKSHGAIVTFEPGSAQDVAGTLPYAGGVTEARSEFTEFDTFFNLTWDKALTDKFDLNLLAGVNYNQRGNDLLFARITDLDIPNFYEISNSASRPTLTQNTQLIRSMGIYAQAELSYDDRYFLTVSGRSDRNSTLPPGNDTYFYPSASISALVLEEGSNFLKLRAGIAGVAGSTTPFLTSNSLVTGNADAFFGAILSPIGGVNYYESSNTLGNPDLKPERTSETEVGVEGAFFDRRLTFDVSAYYSKTKDLITIVPLEPATGYAFQARNIGDLENKGVEVTLGLTPVKNENFRWDVNYTFSKNLNEMTDVVNGQKILINSAYGINFYAVEGEPLGVFQAQVERTNDEGQIIVDPNTGFAEVTDELQTIGDSQRDFVMGLQNTFSYKGLSLTMSFDWKQGGEMYSYTNRLSNFVGNSLESTYNDRNPFVIPNSVNEVLDDDGNVTGYVENTTPVIFEEIATYWGNTQNNPSIEQKHVIDKTFVRLRDVSLTYTFPAKMTERLGLATLSIGAYGKNLFLWTPDENPYVDPEISTFGSDIASEFGEFASNPSQRAYGAILRVSF
jgi:TonB-linked SusC/RagA family outer membrane protein